ncbi:Alpha/Beta hydrolase protein [Cercophora newfieldiana]|uniref:Alpha/Beta hydrolase protein n=1 Tax=Cercophora newfieldiana TaxID=92897 RepID=A0AA40CX02_9PEZI|nr:Alpha/Beta hydrolase protein [Cercophora newfieldiana]
MFSRYLLLWTLVVGLLGVCARSWNPSVTFRERVYLATRKHQHLLLVLRKPQPNPRTAPLTVWLNGGPGAASTTQAVSGHNGPCIAQPGGNSTVLNPWSWNKASNVLYLDQPAGTGFSYGPDGTNTTAKSAKLVADAVKAWVAHWKFQGYRRESINIWSQSYGGHFAPAIAMLLKNHMRINSVGVINGIFDLLIQAPFYPTFAVKNTYNIKTISDVVAEAAAKSMSQPGGCADLAGACKQLQQTYDPQNTGANTTVNDICFGAFQYCWGNVYYPYEALSGLSPFDITQPLPDPIPPPYGPEFLNRQWVRQELGASVAFANTNDAVNTAFLLTGDFVRGYTSELTTLLNAGVKVAMIYGDKDYRANWFGGEAVSLALNQVGKAAFAAKPYTNITITTPGWPSPSVKVKGKVRQHGGLSFSVVYEAGHEVPYYQPEVALQIFDRTLRGRSVATGL